MPETFPLDLPPPGTPWHRASTFFGTHIGATALMTCGWRGAPRVTLQDQSAAGGSYVTWYIGARTEVPGLTVKAARQLLLAARYKGTNSLAATNPAHPILAALAALENLAAIMLWVKTGKWHTPARFSTGPYLSLLSDHPASIPFLPGADQTDGRIHEEKDAVFAAALIACGFHPSGGQDDSGNYCIYVPGYSLTIPGFTRALARATADTLLHHYGKPGIAPVVSLPGYAPGEHPFCYAFHALLNLQQHLRAIQQAATDPTRFLRSPVNPQRTALVTASILHSPSREPLRNALKDHLKKLY